MERYGKRISTILLISLPLVCMAALPLAASSRHHGPSSIRRSHGLRRVYHPCNLYRLTPVVDHDPLAILFPTTIARSSGAQKNARSYPLSTPTDLAINVLNVQDTVLVTVFTTPLGHDENENIHLDLYKNFDRGGKKLQALDPNASPVVYELTPTVTVNGDPSASQVVNNTVAGTLYGIASFTLKFYPAVFPNSGSEDIKIHLVATNQVHAQHRPSRNCFETITVVR